MSEQTTQKPAQWVDPNVAPQGAAWQEARMLANSPLIPQAFRGDPAAAYAAMSIARSTGGDPVSVMYSIHLIQGKPTFSSAFVIGAFNKTGRFGPINYEWRGEQLLDDGEPNMEWACRAWARDREFGDKCVGPWISWRMAVSEGWTTKKGSKWKTIPEHMMRFRAATFFVRSTAPEILVGLHTTEELQDMGPGPKLAAKDARDALNAAARDVTPSEDDLEAFRNKSAPTDGQEPVQAPVTDMSGLGQPIDVEASEARPTARERRRQRKLEQAGAEIDPETGEVIPEPGQEPKPPVDDGEEVPGWED